MGKPGGCSDEVYISASEEIVKDIRAAMDNAKTELEKYVDVPTIWNRLHSPPRLPSGVAVNDSIDHDHHHNNDDDDDHREMVCDKIKELDITKKQTSADIRKTAMLMVFLSMNFTCGLPPWHVHLGEIDIIGRRFVRQMDKAYEVYFDKLGLAPYVNPVPYDDSTPLIDLFYKQPGGQAPQ
ncbi:hypothetical protein ACP275_14G125600 [Erythranthe tilingii]